MLTFKNLKYGAVARAGGEDPYGENFLQYCNGAVRQLMTRGDWFSTVAPMSGCVRNNIITWPRGVGTILAMNVRGRPSTIANKWYQFTPMEQHHYREGIACQEGIRDGNFHCRGNVVTETCGTSCVFNPVAAAAGMFFQFYPSQPTDVGRKITVYGIDGNGQTIRSQRPDQTFQDGIEMLLRLPFVQSPFPIRHVHRVVKDETDGVVNGYQFNPEGGFLLDLAQYQPSETNPEYITTRITGLRGGNLNGGCIEQIEALVKLEFVPFKYDFDLVQIDNESAIRDMFLSIRYKEKGDMANSAAYEMSAMNSDLRNRMPDRSTPISIRAMGTALPRRHMIGNLI